MTRARTEFKPEKSRSLVIKNGKVIEKVQFTIPEIIPTLKEKSVKSLGKISNSSMSEKIDKLRLAGRFKV